ncbi:matrixin family metalloprotease [Flavobacterium terrigena]|uniref:Archaemetzincin n=1 Tax=Flavobacterium terrigena TaxID=402734 RepID=A0A1H6W260_9FLAO|nr:matrixin family metalloprotease [Flavobacterium terrigena]SEJ10973.1 archaemetzincin [Flavobacterium terrigena]
MKIYVITIILLLVSCSKEKSIDYEFEKRIVGIQPYEKFSQDDAKLISFVIDSFYRLETKVLPNIPLPKRAFTKIKSPRYRADSIIKIQNQNIPKDVYYVLGLTNEDISVTKNDKNGKVLEPKWKYCDFGIMGLAYRHGKSAIVSKFRVKSNNHKTEMTRLRKVAIHEFGHNLGLPHCPDKKCVMTSAAEKLTTIDNEKLALCDKCKKIIDYKY